VNEPVPVTIVWKRKKGTLVIEGPLVVRDEDGNAVPIPPPKHPGITKFCGCGKSLTKPFCDGSHKRE